MLHFDDLRTENGIIFVFIKTATVGFIITWQLLNTRVTLASPQRRNTRNSKEQDPLETTAIWLVLGTRKNAS